MLTRKKISKKKVIEKAKVCLVFFSSNFNGLSGGGGAERRFFRVFEEYQKQENGSIDLALVTDRSSYVYFKELGIITSSRKVYLAKIFNHKSSLFKLIRYFSITIALIRYVIIEKPSLMHFFLPSAQYLPFLLFLRIFRIKSPKIAISIVDCSFVNSYLSQSRGMGINIYQYYLEHLQIDGVFTYYQNVSELIPKMCKKNCEPFVFSTRHGFTDINKFIPSKEKEDLIVYAARLDEQKDPFFFLEALKILFEKDSLLYDKWQFKIFGKGPLENKIISYLRENNLEAVQLTYNKDLSEVFSKSKIFISTQKFENFPSMSMIEAMASGNAILAKDVGQTELFVHDNKNGFIVNPDVPSDLSEKLSFLLHHSEKLQEMGRESRRIVLDNHTVGEFLYDLNFFWDKTLAIN